MSDPSPVSHRQGDQAIRNTRFIRGHQKQRCICSASPLIYNFVFHERITKQEFSLEPSTECCRENPRSFDMMIMQCITCSALPAMHYTCRASPKVHHLEFIICSASPAVHHLQCITYGASPAVHHLQCITCNALHLQSIT